MKKIFILGVLLVSFTIYAKAQDVAVLTPTDTNDLFEMSLEQLINVEITTTSRSSGQKSNVAPATVTVITEEQIHERGYRSLLDIMYDLLEFKVDFGVDPRWMNDITVRGIRNMTNFIIMQDGIRINAPTNDFIPVMENYPVNHAKQVEIVYGPASALYGADAFAGVVNIITKKPEEGIEIGNASVQGGTHGYFLGNLSYAKSFSKDLSFNLSGQYMSDAQPALEEYYPDDFTYVDPITKTKKTLVQLHEEKVFPTYLGTMSPKYPISNKITRPLGAYALNFSMQYKRFNFGVFKNYALHPTSQPHAPNESVYNSSNYFAHNVISTYIGNTVKISDRLSNNVTISYSQYELDPNSNFKNVYSELEPGYKYAKGQQIKLEDILSYQYNNDLIVTAGFSLERFYSIPRSNDFHYPVDPSNLGTAIILNTMSIPEFNGSGMPASVIDVYYNNYGGFLQFQWAATEKINLTLGSRFDMRSKYLRETEYWTTVNPRAGVVFTANDKTTIKALFGTAFLAPSPQVSFDRFGSVLSGPMFFTPGEDSIGNFSFFRQLPNPDIKPQQISTSEVSIRRFLNSKLALTVTGYYNDISNLVLPVVNGEKAKELYPNNVSGPNNKYAAEATTYTVAALQINDNVGKQTTYGGTLQLDYFNKISDKLNINANLAYSFIDGTFDPDGDGAIVAKNLGSVSQHTVKSIVTLRYSKIFISTQLIAMSGQRTFEMTSFKDMKYNEAGNPLEGETTKATKFQELPGFVLINLNMGYDLNKNITFFAKGYNVLDQRYYNVNFGAAPDSPLGAGSAAAEMKQGVPQYPIRFMAGVKLSL